MAGKSGKSGRKTSGEEYETRKICIAALIRHYGSLEYAIERLLTSQEPALIKFVFEHAFGKPQEKVELTDRRIRVVFQDQDNLNGSNLAALEENN